MHPRDVFFQTVEPTDIAQLGDTVMKIKKVFRTALNN